MKKSLFLLYLLLLWISGMFAQMSGNYTINQDSATSSTNFHSIQEAVDSLVANGVNGPVYLTVVSGSGPYVERVNFSIISGASVTSGVTFDGNGETLKYDWTSTSQKHTMLLATRYCTIKNFHFEQEWGGWGIRLTGISGYNTIENNTFNFRFGNVWTGIGILSGNCGTAYGFNCRVSTFHNTIRNNKIYGAEIGIFMSGGYQSYSTGNVIDNNLVEDCDRYGIYMGGQRNSVVSNNDISRPNRWLVGPFSGIHFYYFSDQNNVISSNRIHNSHGGALTRSGAAYGIYFEHNQALASSPILIYNNLIYDFNTTDTACGIFMESNEYIKIAHNTVAFENENSDIGSGFGICTQYYNWQQGNELVNNIFYINRGGSNPQYGIYVHRNIDYSNHNNIVVTGNGPGNKYIGVNDSLSALTLSQWQGLYNFGHDTNSVSINPLFRDVERGLFHINKDSVQNIGIPYIAVKDFYNVVRDTAHPDPGAVESDLIYNDLGLLEVYQGNATCSGNYPLEVIAKNYGLNPLYSAQTYWQINNGPVDSALVGLNLNLYQSDTVLLDSIIIMDTTIVKVWVGGVNGTIDEFNLNDTITTLPLIKKMEGYYTINKYQPASQTNYQSFKAFVDDLEYLGLCGPVHATVDSGTGIYVERVVIHEIEGSSAINTITIDGNFNTLHYTTSSTEKSVLKIEGTDYLTIENLIISISSASTEGFGIHISGDAFHNTIRKCTLNITNSVNALNSFYGIVCSNNESSWIGATSVDHLTLEENLIKGGFQGISMYGSQYDRIIGVKIIGNYVQDNTYSIRLAQLDGALIDRNDVSRPNATSSGKIHGIELYTGCQNARITNNVIHHSNSLNPPGSSVNWVRAISIETGINFPPTGKENLVYNNLIYKFNSNRSAIWGVCLITTGGCRISHNTIVLDQSVSQPSTQYGIGFLYGTNSNVEITNNNIYLGNLGQNGIGINLSGNINVCDNNNVYLDSTSITGSFNYAYISNTAYHTLSSWQTANSGAYGQSSTSLNPQFRDRSAFNMIPTNNALVGTCPSMTDIPYDLRPKPRDSVVTDPGAFLIAYYNDAGIVSLLDSGFTCLGKAPVRLNVKNHGLDTLKYFTLSWNINGTLKDSLISGINLSTGDSIILQLDSMLLDTAKMVHFWTSLPNGISDERPANDSVFQYFNSRMSGQYTIDKTAPQTKLNYPSFTTFANDLMARGMCGPVVVDVAAGTGAYNEQAEFTDIFGNNAINSIAINGHGNTIMNFAGSQNPYTMKFQNISYLTIDSLNISVFGTSSSVHGMLFLGQENDIHVSNCTIQAPSGANSFINSGIGIFYSLDSASAGPNIHKYNFNIDRCKITGGNYGILGVEYFDSSFHISNNEIYNFKFKGISLTGFQGSSISSNEIHRSNTGNNSEFTGIELLQSTKIDVYQNKIHHSHDNSSAIGLSKTTEGILIRQCSATAGAEINVFNNLIYRMNNKGLLNGIHIDSSSNVLLYYNTISLDESLTSTDEVTGIHVSGPSASTQIKNNIASIERGGNASLRGIQLSAASGYPVVDYNDVYLNTFGSGGSYYGSVQNVNYPNLIGWQTALGGTLGQNSSAESPGYDHSNMDFIPTNVSVNGLADPILFITNDLLDSTRNASQPDPGAYEFDPAGTDLAIYGIVLSDLSRCGDSNQIVRVVVKNNGLIVVDSIPVLLGIQNGGNSDSLWQVIDTLISGQTDTLVLGSLNTFAGGNYNFWSRIFATNDQNPNNDSVFQSMQIFATPYNPKVPDTTICPGEAARLKIQPNGWLYRWYVSDTISSHFNQGLNYNLQPIYADTAFYVASVSLANGCSSERVEFDVFADALKSGYTFSISNKNNVTFTNTSSGLIDSYKWDFGDTTFSTLENPSHTYQKNGVYPVNLTVFGICDTLISTDTIEIKFLGEEGHLHSKAFSVHPNPSNGLVRIIAEKSTVETLYLSVYDLNGKIQFSQELTGPGSHPVDLDLRFLAKGTYLIQIQSEKDQFREKLIIR